jgi:hypothetical protein
MLINLQDHFIIFMPHLVLRFLEGEPVIFALGAEIMAEGILRDTGAKQAGLLKYMLEYSPVLTLMHNFARIAAQNIVMGDFID